MAMRTNLTLDAAARRVLDESTNRSMYVSRLILEARAQQNFARAYLRGLGLEDAEIDVEVECVDAAAPLPLEDMSPARLAVWVLARHRGLQRDCGIK